MHTIARLAITASFFGACNAALAAPIAIAFSGAVTSFKIGGANVGNVGDGFSGKIVFDTASIPLTFQNSGGVLSASAETSGGCATFDGPNCYGSVSPVPFKPLILSGSIDTQHGFFSFDAATDGRRTDGYANRTDGTGAGGGQSAKYSLGNYKSVYDLQSDGTYENTTTNEMIALDILASFGALFSNYMDLNGPLNGAAITSGTVVYASTQTGRSCTKIDLFGCEGSDYVGTAYPQVELFGNIRTVSVGNPAIVPEPAGMALLAAGALGLAAARRRRR